MQLGLKFQVVPPPLFFVVYLPPRGRTEFSATAKQETLEGVEVLSSVRSHLLACLGTKNEVRSGERDAQPRFKGAGRRLVEIPGCAEPLNYQAGGPGVWRDQRTVCVQRNRHGRS